MRLLRKPIPHGVIGVVEELAGGIIRRRQAVESMVTFTSPVPPGISTTASRHPGTVQWLATSLQNCTSS